MMNNTARENPTHEIDIHFHIGNAKSASTTIQDILRRLENQFPEDVIHLGRFDEKSFKNERLKTAHMNLFRPSRAELHPFAPAFQKVEPLQLVKEYAHAIVENITLRQNNPRHVFISDECIYDMANYNGDLNIAYLSYLISSLQEIFAAPEIAFKANFNISLAVRNQITWIPSIIAYSSATKPYDHEVKRILENPRNGWTNTSFYYETACKLRSLFSDKSNIHIAPMEYLSSNNPIDFYLTLFPSAKALFILAEKETPLIFKNIKNSNRKKGKNTDRPSTIIKRFSYRAYLSSQIYFNDKRVTTHTQNRKNPIEAMFLYFYKASNRIDQIIIKRIMRLKNNSIRRFSEEEIIRLTEIYGEGNKKLLLEFPHLKLDEYGYPLP